MEKRTPSDARDENDAVAKLASAALEIIATRQHTSQRSHRLYDLRAVDLLYDAVCGHAPEAVLSTVNDLRAQGFSNIEIADHIVPEVAKKLGESWCSDTAGFAQVTIGCARLHGLLPELGPEWTRRPPQPLLSALRLLIVVPQGAQHSFGATLLTGQFRRLQHEIMLSIGETPEKLDNRLTYDEFDAILISASKHEQVDQLKGIVTQVRQISPRTPILLGGGILDGHSDITDDVGVDLATSDLAKALTFITRHQATHLPKHQIKI